LLAGLLLVAAAAISAQSCQVVHHAPPSEADTAFLAGNYAKAEGLYRAAQQKNPRDIDATAGLVHALLRQMKVLEAGESLRGLGDPSSESAALMTLRGEVEFRQGEPWNAVKTALASYALDKCNPRTLLLLSRLEVLNSQNATGRKLLVKAHQLDPEDAEIQAAWINTLPAEKRAVEFEAYLKDPKGDSADQRTQLQTDLGHLKSWVAAAPKPCTMVSTVAKADIPFVPILSNNDKIIAFGLSVKINNRATRLAIDTSYNARLPVDGASGLLISRAAAQHAGLKPVFENDVPGTGTQAPRSGFVAVADSIAIGDVEFHDCPVQVMDVNFANGAEGIVGLEILSSYLITLDFPAKKLLLDTLPPRPAETVAFQGVYDRYMAPSMSAYTPFFESGSDIILPATLMSGRPPMLFVLDTAVASSAVTPGAGHELTTGHKDPKYESRDPKMNRDGTYLTFDATLNFAGVSLKESPIVPFNTAAFTDDSGMEISGLIGMKTLTQTTMHIDYRDGLLKLDYDPARKGPVMY